MLLYIHSKKQIIGGFEMRKCKVSDCENKHHAKGYCKKHYTQYVLKEALKTQNAAFQDAKIV